MAARTVAATATLPPEPCPAAPDRNALTDDQQRVTRNHEWRFAYAQGKPGNIVLYCVWCGMPVEVTWPPATP